jgi:hypothetical protein
MVSAGDDNDPASRMMPDFSDDGVSNVLITRRIPLP